MHEVSVDTFVELVKQRDVEGIETALRRKHYDIDTLDSVSDLSLIFGYDVSIVSQLLNH